MDATDQPRIDFLRINPETDQDIALPQYMTAQSSGMDVCAALADSLTLAPGDIALIPTGFAMAISTGFEAQIRPRSGLAVKQGITVINSPGTIDADYRGEVKIALINAGKHPYTIRRGDRIAQMVIQRVYQAQIRLVDTLPETKRSTGGFGHTGIS